MDVYFCKPLSSPAVELAVLRTSSLAAAVEREVERLILNGSFAPGERINQNKLASELGTSRGPTGEAIRALEGFGLICSVRNRGSPWAWTQNMLECWARKPILSPWFPLPWLKMRCRSQSSYGCSCPTLGSRIRSACSTQACLRPSGWITRSWGWG